MSGKIEAAGPLQRAYFTSIYLIFLSRIRDQVPESETAKFADFALDSLKKTRVREFAPSRQEIITLLGRRKITTTVHCYGEGSCQITIDSSTTSGEVVDTLCKGKIT